MKKKYAIPLAKLDVLSAVNFNFDGNGKKESACRVPPGLSHCHSPPTFWPQLFWKHLNSGTINCNTLKAYRTNSCEPNQDLYTFKDCL